MTALVVVVAGLGACTTTGSSPATAPANAPSSSVATTSQPRSTTTSPAVTTTTTDRLSEVAAILEDLERRRLAAIYSGDVEAFSALFADTPYLERSLEVFDLVEPGTPPQITIEVIDILRDDEFCIAVWESATVDGIAAGESSTILMRDLDRWVLAYVSEEKGGWMCDGPHPLSE